MKKKKGTLYDMTTIYINLYIYSYKQIYAYVFVYVCISFTIPYSSKRSSSSFKREWHVFITLKNLQYVQLYDNYIDLAAHRFSIPFL